jgi:quercetin dioxygenase-like cupin family protein
MPVYKYLDSPFQTVREGVTRKIITLENLMTVLIEFANGPWKVADPFHSHPHEQTTYVADGEIIFYCEGESDEHLIAGDMFYVPSGKKHTIKVLTPIVRLIDNFSPIRKDFIK